MNGKKRKSTKKKKFFILIACYLAIFVITSALTLATLSWFSGSTWSSNTVYMGGPVYIKFTDNAENETSGTNKLVLKLPEGWDRLYPGMNIQIEAKAVIQGAKFENKKDNGDELIVYTTGAILRAKVMLTVTDPMGYSNLNPHPSTEEGYADKNDIIADVYKWVWPQLQIAANTNSGENKGSWIYDQDSPEDEKFFYFTKNTQSASHTQTGSFELQDLGGTEQNVSVGFLNNAIITMPGEPLTNKHAECKLTFTIVFHALQAFLPYESDEIGSDKSQYDTSFTTGTLVTKSDEGTPKPLTIGNSRDYFAEAFSTLYPDQSGNGGNQPGGDDPIL